MDILKIIDKKRTGNELTKEEIKYAFNGYLNGKIKDYQMSSLLMSICINGMSYEETLTLTNTLLHSGTIIKNGEIEKIQVDKHSTGGVGDKTSIIIGPILASLGLKMAKLSGRGLGHTGGTIDKLESIPGFRVTLSKEEFIESANRVGFVECEQTSDFTPLDRMIYNLRSVTGTVSSIPLIASSIMSKKLAVGSDYILIDVKVGEGALIKTREEGVELSDLMIKIGKSYNKTILPVLTTMDEPLGDNVGNALEVLEAIEILKGKCSKLRFLAIELSSVLYSNAMNVSIQEARQLVANEIDSGRAYNKFVEFVRNQGGYINRIQVAPYKKAIKSKKSGTITNVSALEIGYLALNLGAGRKTKDAKIDHGVGVKLMKHSGEKVKEGDILCYLYQNNDKDHTKEVLKSFTIVE